MKYIAYVDCKRGDSVNTKNIEFTADESDFQRLDSKDQNKLALKLVLEQSPENIDYDEVAKVSGFYKK
jgi:hypothetical protein